MQPAVPELDIALVIPAHNDNAGLARLLAQAQQLGCFSQIIVVDDGSDPAFVPQRADALTLIHHDAATGPGRARNHGLEQVRAEYLLFFDADDLLTAELPLLLSDLALAAERDGAFDFCVFRYADSRIAAEGRWGQPEWEDSFWRRANCPVFALAALPAAQWPVLARCVNYPWNKVYRTAFLRENGVRLGETLVHEDVVLHWLGFLAARRVLVSSRICAWHQVARRGSRLTNLRGSERLQVFTPLAEVATRVAPAPDPAWRQAFVDFALGLLDWTALVIDPALRAQLHRDEQGFLADLLARLPALAQGLAPDLAARLQRRAEGPRA